MEKGFISCKEIKDIIEKNYLAKVVPQISNLYQLCQKKDEIFISVDIKQCEIGENKGLNITFYYTEPLLFYKQFRDLTVCKENDTFFILTSQMSLEKQEEILSKIDFSEIYDYYLSCEFPNKVYNLNGQYNHNGQSLTFPITIKNGNSIAIEGSRDYSISYSMQLSVSKKEEVICPDLSNAARSKSWEGNAYKLKSLYSADNNFLSNLMVDFEDLPEYIQGKLQSSVFSNNEIDEQNNQIINDVPKRKILRRLLKLKRN